MSERYVGTSVPRVEDRALLSGAGKYLADLRISDLLEVAIVRSTEARATIGSIDTAAADDVDGVVAVICAADLIDSVKPLDQPFYWLDPDFVAATDAVVAPYAEPILALGAVTRVGQPVAAIVACERAIAEDARDKVEVAYVSERPVLDVHAALAPGAPLVDPRLESNVHATFSVTAGTPDALPEGASRAVSGRFRFARSVGCPMENRGVIATWHASSELLEVWSSTQVPHVLRRALARSLGLQLEAVRVRVPDMGGSFGGGVYVEEILIAAIARQIGQPVRWLEDRAENLVNARHSRDQEIDATLRYDAAGRAWSLQLDVLQDTGSSNPFGLTLPYNVVSHARSVYDIPHFRATGACVLTNKTRNTPVRGAGRCEATLVIDRLLDLAALELGLDAAEIRRRNLIPASAMPYRLGMPYRDGVDAVYDSGDFPDQFEALLQLADYEGLRRRQDEARSTGKHLGIGLSCHVEGTGIGPHEGALVRVELDGSVTVRSGAQPHGQSHHTVLAQVVADELGVAHSAVTVRTGDTALLAFGAGTFGSRTAVTAGSAVLRAAEAVRAKLIRLAAHLLEADESDLTIVDGAVRAIDAPTRAIDFIALAGASQPGPAARLPQGMDFGLEATSYFVPPTVTFASGSHLALVDVDIDSCLVTVLEYFAVDDVGRPLNPAVVDGQVFGGILHGLSNALLEEVVYDDVGQCTTTSFADYLLASSAETPRMTVRHRSHPTPLNPLGVKGAGEGATSSAPAAILNAVADALLPLRVDLTTIPITPWALADAIEAARGRTVTERPLCESTRIS